MSAFEDYWDDDCYDESDYGDSFDGGGSCGEVENGSSDYEIFVTKKKLQRIYSLAKNIVNLYKPIYFDLIQSTLVPNTLTASSSSCPTSSEATMISLQPTTPSGAQGSFTNSLADPECGVAGVSKASADENSCQNVGRTVPTVRYGIPRYYVELPVAWIPVDTSEDDSEG